MPNETLERRDRDFIGLFGKSPRFARTRHDLLLSPAYLVLSPIQRLILRDFIERYERASRFDKSWWAHKQSLSYTYVECAEPCGRATFYRALTALERVGFIRRTTRRKEHDPQDTRWQPADRWKNYVPQETEVPALRAYIRRRAADPATHNDPHALTALKDVDAAPAPTPEPPANGPLKRPLQGILSRILHR